MLFGNAEVGRPTIFTTTELIGFVLSVLLSGASIVLAVTAISIGKSSEQSVIKRSDESIRLQNEVFIKTTEALQRIEASTGVTEKRIEDIISGRVGDISHQIAEMATSGGKRRPIDVKELEENIRRSITSAVRKEDSADELKKMELKFENDKIKESKYQSAHQKLLLNIGNRDSVEIQKIGHGSVGQQGEELFDGVYEYSNNKIALSTFRDGMKIDTIKEFVSDGAKEISKGFVQKFILVLLHDTDENKEDHLVEVQEAINLLKDELSSKIQVVAIDYEKIEPDASKIVL